MSSSILQTAYITALLPLLLCTLSLSTLPSHASPSPSPPSSYPSTPSCKAIPGTPDWPDSSVWAKLNESTGGRLLRPTPPGAVCHPGQDTYDPTRCKAVQSAWSSYAFHEVDPVSSMSQEFNNDTCLPEPSYPCSGAGYPVFVINATSSEHVKMGVDFARGHNIRLIVKSTGHDYLGRSVAPNSLSIWTRHLKGMKAHDYFRPDKCGVTIDHTAATLAGGTQMMEAYTFLHSINQTIVGGGGKSVGLGGYLSAGGHALLSARRGLATDQILEMEVVTPSGEIIVANECQNTDLFWAMRGGGSSTYGVMTSVTVKTYPSPPLVGLNLFVVTPHDNTTSIWSAVSYIISQYPSLGDQGLSGYSFIVSNYPNPLDGGASNVTGIAASMVLQDTQDPDDMNRLWEPVLSHVNQTWPGLQILPNATAFPSFLSWYGENFDQSTTGHDTYLGSRLLDAEALTADPEGNSEVFRDFTSSQVGSFYLVGGKGVREAKPRGGSNSVLPAWRKAYVHATSGIDFKPLNKTAEEEAISQINAKVAALRKIAPDSGAYINEAAPFEPDWQHQFWGENYERLVDIKRAVDPTDVFWCHPCVGNDRWREIDGRLCRV